MPPAAIAASRTAAPVSGDLRTLMRDARVRVAAAVMLLLAVAAMAIPGMDDAGDMRTLAAAAHASLDAWRATFGPAFFATVMAWVVGGAMGIACAAAPRACRDVLRPALKGVGAIPVLLLVLACIVVTGTQAGSLVAAIAAGQCLRYARDALAIVERERAQPYVEAARGLVVPRAHVWQRHVLPNCASRLMLLPLGGTLRSAATAHATIAFLGLAPGTAGSLGGVIAQSLSPAQAAGAAVLLCVSLLALNVLATRVRAFGAGEVAW